MSDAFLEGNIYPFMDNHEVPTIDILNLVEQQKETLNLLKKLSLEERKIRLKKFNKIDKSLIDYVLEEN